MAKRVHKRVNFDETKKDFQSIAEMKDLVVDNIYDNENNCSWQKVFRHISIPEEVKRSRENRQKDCLDQSQQDPSVNDSEQDENQLQTKDKKIKSSALHNKHSFEPEDCDTSQADKNSDLKSVRKVKKLRLK